MMTRLFGVRGPDITPDALKKYSNDFKIEKIKKPVLIIHGTMDWIIPPEEAQIIYKALPNDIDKKVILIEGAGHNDIFSYQDEYFNPLKDFIKKFQ
jgi:pimeloyl-ACP methyl ester carboxylesterase